MGNNDEWHIRLENGFEWHYYGHYCKYCKRCYSSRYITRHNKSNAHKNNQILFKHDHIIEQIKKQLVIDFKEGRYDPDDINLKGEKRKKRFEQLERETMERYDEARKDGYFDKLDFDEDIDFPEYKFYQKMGIKLNAQKEVFTDDPDADDE